MRTIVAVLIVVYVLVLMFGVRKWDREKKMRRPQPWKYQ